MILRFAMSLRLTWNSDLFLGLWHAGIARHEPHPHCSHLFYCHSCYMASVPSPLHSFTCLLWGLLWGRPRKFLSEVSWALSPYIPSWPEQTGISQKDSKLDHLMTLIKMTFPTFPSLSSWKRKFDILRNADWVQPWASQRNDVLKALLLHPSLIWGSEKKQPSEMVLV